MKIIKRLIQFYQRSEKLSSANKSIIWEGIVAFHHKSLLDALNSGNELATEQALDSFGPNGGLQGIENNLCWPDGHPTTMALEKEGFDLHVPDCFGFKFSPPEGGVPSRLPLYCDVSKRVRWANHGNIPERTLEIGSGLGFLGLLFFRAGAKSWTCVDLPTTAVFCAYFLSKCIGEKNIWFSGESSKLKGFARFYTCSNYLEIGSDKFDAICNINSFPEISNTMQDAYLRFIPNVMDDGCSFIPWNHESPVLAQRCVTQAVLQNPQSGLVCVSKTNTPIIEGYFEEIYQKAQ